MGFWKNYSKIKFLWPGVSSPFPALSTSKQNKTNSSNEPASGLRFVAGAEGYADWPLYTVCVHYVIAAPTLLAGPANEQLKGRKGKLLLSSENQR